MSKRLATAARKNSPLTGRNLKQNRALGGRPSALTGWIEANENRSCLNQVNCAFRQSRETYQVRNVYYQQIDLNVRHQSDKFSAKWAIVS